MKIKMSQKRLAPAKRDPRITKTVTFNGPGWEFSVTGRASFVKKMMKKYVPAIQRVAEAYERTD